MARVLVIDDDETVRDYLCAVLELGGHDVFQADDGRSGLRTFHTQRPDVTIVDVIMPGKDGVTTIGEIHMACPDAAVVAISGGEPEGPRSDLPIAWAYGAALSLRKPVAAHVLLSVIDELCGTTAPPAVLE